MITTIIFDLWGTLADYDRKLDLMLKEDLGVRNFSIGHNFWHFALKAWHSDPEGDAHRFFPQLCERLGIPAEKGVPALEKFWTAQNASQQFYSDVEPGLKALRGKYKLYLLSNTGKDGPHLFNQHPTIKAQFDDLFFSYQIGACKPDKEAFAHVWKAANTKPAECLMVGDNPRMDIEGALHVGMNALLIDRNGWHKNEKHITTITELASVVSSL